MQIGGGEIEKIQNIFFFNTIKPFCFLIFFNYFFAYNVCTQYDSNTSHLFDVAHMCICVSDMLSEKRRFWVRNRGGVGFNVALMEYGICKIMFVEK